MEIRRCCPLVGGIGGVRRDGDDTSWVGFWIFAVSLAAWIAAWIAAQPLFLRPVAALTGKLSRR